MQDLIVQRGSPNRIVHGLWCEGESEKKETRQSDVSAW